MKTKIYYAKPSITELEVSFANDAAIYGWGEKCYEYINRFEKLFQNYLEVNYTIATSSCTGALHLGLDALGIGPGDEVIIADSNWIASVSPIVKLGAKPVFVDILKDTWCIDPIKAEEAITKNTKAILAVHLYGNLCDMKSLLEIGDKYDIPIIEDAAEAIGSVYHGKKAGSMGRFSTFSFHGTKTITTGEGGMFVTNDKDLYEKVLTLSNHGRSRNQTKQFWSELVGHKYKMSNIQAAIGCAQMSRIEELVNRKRKILSIYKDKLIPLSGISMNHEGIGIVNGSWMPTIVFDEKTKITREILLSAFKKENIDARIFFWPLSSLEMFDLKKSNLNSYSIPNRAINLPSYHDITREEIYRVVDVINLLM